MNIQAIETASFQAWPALEEQSLPFATLRYAEGYSKRVNSASLNTNSRIAVNDLIHETEKFFREKKLDSVIRVPRLSGCGFSELDDQLAHQDYQLVAPTHVMTVAIDSAKSAIEKAISNQTVEPAITALRLSSVHEVSASDWLSAFSELVDEDVETKQAHAAMVNRVPEHSLFLVLRNASGLTLACGFAVANDGYVGFFNIAVSREFRGQGLGYQLMKALLSWAHAQKAHTGYLQVEQSNVAAVRLYEKLQFRKYYQYWYRVKSNQLTSNK